MSVLQERIFHPTYLRLLCLHIRRRSVSLADASAVRTPPRHTNHAASPQTHQDPQY